MNFLEETFVIIHIRISDASVYFIKMRTAVTVALILFLLISSFQIYQLLAIGPFTFLVFVQDLAYVFMILYISMLWVKTWTKANRHLNRAVKKDNETKDDS